MKKTVLIVGAGLAGTEAAWQCARRGIAIELCEMRPVRATPAHQTADFAELVCSNSLKSDSENTAPWLLKEEMRRAGSLLMRIARECAVPAGHALAVDRVAFAAKVTEAIAGEPRIDVRREEVTVVEEGQITIIATGPLTSDALAAEIVRLSGNSGAKAPFSGEADDAALKRCSSELEEGGTGPGAEGLGADGSSRAGVPAPHVPAPHVAAPHLPAPHLAEAHEPQLYFYDSISPIVEADSIDMARVYMAARYDKGSADYINCPMTREEYDRFCDGLLAAQSVEEKDWEKLNY